MIFTRLLMLLAIAACGVLLAGPATAAAGWHYTFKKFIETSATAGSSGVTSVARCGAGVAGEWRLTSKFSVEVSTSSKPKQQEVDFVVRAKMPITTKFRPVHAVDVNWTAVLPEDPAEAELATQNYERIAQGQSDFYEGMSVRWRPAKKKLDIRHDGLRYGEYPSLPPGEVTTAFKPKPGC